MHEGDTLLPEHRHASASVVCELPETLESIHPLDIKFF